MVASHAILVVVTAIKVYSFAKLARQSSMTQTPLVKLLIRDGTSAPKYSSRVFFTYTELSLSLNSCFIRDVSYELNLPSLLTKL